MLKLSLPTIRHFALRLVAVLGVVAALGWSATDRGVAAVDPTVTILPGPDTAVCGSFSEIWTSVRDTTGGFAVDGTNVVIATTLGSIQTPLMTDGGLVISRLVIPTRTSGAAEISVTALGVTSKRTISVTCASATPPPQVVTVAPPAPAAVTAAPAGPAQTGAVVTQAPGGPAPIAVAVRVADFNYTPASFNVRVGQPVAVNVTNGGNVVHTFTINGVADSGSISPGATTPVQFMANQAGTLTFYCTIHGAAVMSGTVNVAP